MSFSLKLIALVAATFVAVVVLSPEAHGYPECPYPEPVNSTYFPDEEDCRYFYQCSHGNPIHMECPPGTVFNATLEVCDSSDLSCLEGAETHFDIKIPK